MKTYMLASAAIVAGLAGSASAELSFGIDAAVGTWANHSTDTGLQGHRDRKTGKLGLSVANDFGGFVGQVDLNWQALTMVDGDEDATKSIFDLTLRGMRDFGGVQGGVFLGKGEHQDYGDSDEYMSYQFIGFDAEKDMSFGTVYGQLGYLDSRDEYGEGTQRAAFLRVGGDYEIGNGLTVTGAFSMAKGRKWDSDQYGVDILGIELGVEKAIGDNGLSLYGSYEHTKIEVDYKDGYGDEFGTLWVGLKMNLGGDTKRGSKLPNLGQWVAYNANEVE